MLNPKTFLISETTTITRPQHADADSGIVRFPRQVCFTPPLPSVVVYGWLLGLQLTIMVGSWEGLATSKRWVDGVAQQQLSLSVACVFFSPHIQMGLQSHL
jgi:hypothetical protein